MKYFLFALLLCLLFLGCCYAAGQYLYGGYGQDRQLQFIEKQQSEQLERLRPPRRHRG